MNLLRAQYVSSGMPAEINAAGIFPGFLTFCKKNRIEFEVFGCSGVSDSKVFLTSLENRFWIYKQICFYEQQEFSLCFQSMDVSTQTVLFTSKRKKVACFCLLGLLLEKNSLLGSVSKKVLVKSRIFRMVKGGFVSLCFGSPCFVLGSPLLIKGLKQDFYMGWFVHSLRYYGFLSYYTLVDFEKRLYRFFQQKRVQNPSYKKRAEFYFFCNGRVKCTAGLEK